MTPQRKRGTVSPTLLAFGRRFKRFRDANGWSQEAAAARANGGQGVTSQYIGAVENGRTRCTLEFAEGMDAAFGAEGQLVDLWHDFVEDATFPEWFDWLEVEAVAAQLQSYQPLLVHGLLQTPAYASAILGGNEKKVEGRLKRQEILRRDEPPAPIFSLLLDQVALERPVGDAETMRQQLDHLENVSAHPNITVQVVPSDGTHDGNSGAFVLATLADRSEFAYSDTAARGFTMTDPDDIAAFSRVLIEIRALALPVSQSLDLIRRTRDERWKT
ncbi:helix-turn-helix domain-containing protein [Spirillospora sp. CA-294931]|uniref:helix-turn-helix domain-containing protein n=1 Tax=Spirillospora sp. CA-294931 TaxID=3240042 RepID=UPI003D94CDFE